MSVQRALFWIHILGEIEHWNEDDSDIDADFKDLSPTSDCVQVDHLCEANDKAIIWWIVTFTCVFQTLHSLSSRSISWLLMFLSTMLTFFGRHSDKIARLSTAFPSTLYQRNQYLNKLLVIPSVYNYVVCPTCLFLYKYEHCLEIRGAQTQIKPCPHCLQKNKIVPLLKEIVTSTGNKKNYPLVVYPSISLISCLQSLLSRPNFYNQCELWRHSFETNCTSISDVYCGKLWKDFLCFEGKNFLGTANSIAFMMNIDWFQPFKHRTYSIGVIYLAIMNLPRSIRFKRENIIIIGLIPGPSEPSLNINSFLTPLVSELLTLWEGFTFTTFDCGSQLMRCALLCVGCDLPAGRKACGFLSYTANLGCSRCYCKFGTGVFGRMDYSGFRRDVWVHRTNREHREDIKKILACSTKTERQREESKSGCRYSSLLQLPYFDPVRMLIIDPMHNLYLGTAKHIFSKIWVGRGMIDTASVLIINKRIASLIIPPSVRFNRLPPCMQYPSSLTAEQWMLWVNYYSIYCLYGMISSEHLECWRHFVLASRILCKQKCSGNDIKVADALLLRFCRRFELLYGPDSITPNIHLHAHLSECIKDYGPMSTFWLFSFERFNGILGDEPTNNRSIEVQLVTRFMKDNAHLQLLLSVPNASSDITDTFSRVVIDQSCNFTSTKHLDARSEALQDQSVTETIIPAIKHTISIFSETEMKILSDIYHEVYSDIPEDLYLPQSYQKMDYVTIHGQKVSTGQYILARSVFSFSQSHTLQLRPAKIEYFFKHSVLVSESDCVSHIFAAVSWPMHHPLRHHIGKPYEIWCTSAFETCNKNFILPLDNFSCVLLTGCQVYLNQTVLITVPLIS